MTSRGRGAKPLDELMRGVRSFHIRHTRADEVEPKVERPVHVLYYRAIRPDLVEILRVLHERMEPSRHLGEASEE